jgi:hypothetical protein
MNTADLKHTPLLTPPGTQLHDWVTKLLLRAIQEQLAPLSTADKNRVLLLLSAYILQELEALETETTP